MCTSIISVCSNTEDIVAKFLMTVYRLLKVCLTLGFVLVTTDPCLDGQRLPLSGSCSSYLFCKDGKWTQTSCPPQQIFNTLKDSCVGEKEYICKNRPICYPEGIVIPNENCLKYEACLNGSWVVFECFRGFTFDPSKNVCVEEEGTTCYGCDYDQPDPTNCRGYFTCKGSMRVKMSCMQSQFFDAVNNKCVEMKPGQKCYSNNFRSTIANETIEEISTLASENKTLPPNITGSNELLKNTTSELTLLISNPTVHSPDISWVTETTTLLSGITIPSEDMSELTTGTNNTPENTTASELTASILNSTAQTSEMSSWITETTTLLSEMTTLTSDLPKPIKDFTTSEMTSKFELLSSITDRVIFKPLTAMALLPQKPTPTGYHAKPHAENTEITSEITSPTTDRLTLTSSSITPFPETMSHTQPTTIPIEITPNNDLSNLTTKITTETNLTLSGMMSSTERTVFFSEIASSPVISSTDIIGSSQTSDLPKPMTEAITPLFMIPCRKHQRMPNVCNCQSFYECNRHSVWALKSCFWFFYFDEESLSCIFWNARCAQP